MSQTSAPLSLRGRLLHNELSYNVITASSFRCGELLLEGAFYLALVTNGTATQACGAQVRRLRPRELLVLTPSLRVALTEPAADFALTCLRIAPPYFDSLPDGTLLYRQAAGGAARGRMPVCRLADEDFLRMRAALDLFRFAPDGERMYERGVARHLCSGCLLMAADLLAGGPRDAAGYVSRGDEIFRRFKRLLMEHYRKAHTVAFYAGQLCISPAYLSRIVKRTTGRTVRDHVARLLAAEARRQLDCTDREIKEIAHDLGFADASAFGKFFRKEVHASPTAFRRCRP